MTQILGASHPKHNQLWTTNSSGGSGRQLLGEEICSVPATLLRVLADLNSAMSLKKRRGPDNRP